MGDRPPWTNRRAPEPTATPPYNRCSRWPAGWDTRCPRSPDNQMPKGNRREIDHSLIRTGDSVLKHGPVGTTPRSSASVVDNLDICRPVARDRTLRYHLNQRVGTFNPTVVNSGMVITNRETLHRPGPHPHRSVRTSFDPHFIFIHHTFIRLHLLHRRIMRSLLFINNLPHVQKHAHHLRIGIIQRHTHWILSMDCCLRREACPFSYTAWTLHCPDACLPWDIVRFRRTLRRSFIVPLARWVAGRCRPVACWRAWQFFLKTQAWC